MKPLYSMPYSANPNQYELTLSPIRTNTLYRHREEQREKDTMAEENKSF
jgi:hypothetical protein